jgi:hypothetical protein
MNTLLILIMGYCIGRSDHYHEKARENWDLFRDAFNKGLRDE